MIIDKKWIYGFAVSLLIVWAAAAQAAPPIPARIGGTVTFDGAQLTQTTDAGYTFVVTKQDGTAYEPEAKDSDGLNAYNWYVIDIPIYDANHQTGGAHPGDTAVIRLYRDGSELALTSPVNGRFTVGASGSVTRIDIQTDTGARKAMPWLSLLLLHQNRAELSVFFDPNPVLPYTGSCPCWPDLSPEWHYVAYVQEQIGVRVTISRFTWDFYDSSGVWLGRQVCDDNDFSDWFDDCGLGSVYIEPYSTVCGSLCAYIGGRPSGSVIMTFYGTDDNGNDISASERVRLDSVALPQFDTGNKGHFAAPEIRPR